MGTIQRAAALAFCLAVFGCANADRPISLDEFYSFCWPAQIDYNCPDDNLCQDFKDYLAQEHKGVQDCVAGCLALNQAKSAAFPLSCAYPLQNATDWCESYCRRAYAPGGPLAEQATGNPQPGGDVTEPVAPGTD